MDTAQKLGAAARAAGALAFACALAAIVWSASLSAPHTPRFQRFNLVPQVASATRPRALADPAADPAPVGNTEAIPTLAPSVSDAIAEAARTGEAPPPPSLAATPPPLAPPVRNGVIATNFDLGDRGAAPERIAGDAVVVRKVFRMNGGDIGSAAVHVDAGSRLLVDRQDLARLLRDTGRTPPPALQDASGLATFNDLRRRGIDLRYDPGSDTISLALPD